ncbi:MAG: hypothetical protein M1827_005599 [Pycnora praestabilis]|nr:MAG: hypothetical protein M1827_005599 [Pycnora praestabilis]
MPFSHSPKALLFDVFGTVVDWRSTVTNYLISQTHLTLSAPTSSLPSRTRLRASTMTPQDWGVFAQQWRNSYKHFTRTSDPTTSGKNVDDHHHDALISLLHDWELDGLWDKEQLEERSRIWHFLEPWADSSTGLEELNKAGIITATLSNGNVSLLSDMAHYAHLPWTRIFSSEHFKAYKPNPKMYEGAVRGLGLHVGNVAMVAAHLGDLKAARGCGLKTIYVERELEEDWTREEIEEARREGWVDLWVGLGEGEGGFLVIARKLNEGNEEECGA